MAGAVPVGTTTGEGGATPPVPEIGAAAPPVIICCGRPFAAADPAPPSFDSEGRTLFDAVRSAKTELGDASSTNLPDAPPRTAPRSSVGMDEQSPPFLGQIALPFLVVFSCWLQICFRYFPLGARAPSKRIASPPPR